MITIPVRLINMEIDAYNEGKDKQYAFQFSNHSEFPMVSVKLRTAEKSNLKIGQEYILTIESKA